jgi:hypothetical protein
MDDTYDAVSEAVASLRKINFGMQHIDGHNYFWLRIGDGVDLDLNLVDEWCTETYGSNNSAWFKSDRKYYFYEEKDAGMFLLKWQ